jgi:hypothetical protein
MLQHDTQEGEGSSCSGDVRFHRCVCWPNISLPGQRWYGSTENGAYVCRNEAHKARMRATRSAEGTRGSAGFIGTAARLSRKVPPSPSGAIRWCAAISSRQKPRRILAASRRAFVRRGRDRSASGPPKAAQPECWAPTVQTEWPESLSHPSCWMTTMTCFVRKRHC